MLEQCVQEFNETYKSNSINSKPVIPTNKEQITMILLILEEVEELKESFKNQDKVGVLDAITDILYITAQQGNLYGYPIEKAIQEVHRSNMSKLGEDGKPIIRKDGKVLKGPNFKEPKLQEILDANRKRSST